MNTITKQQAMDGIKLIKLVADSIKELKRVPNGHLYAMLMSILSLQEYEKIINILKNAGVIELKNNELFWIL